jgi:hypothetical protein
MKKLLTLLLGAAMLVGPVPFQPAQAQVSTIRSIVFPVIGSVTYYDDFGNARSGGRTHEGNDLMGKKMLPLVAAVDGTITNVNYPEESWGYSVTIRDKDDYTYHYLHMNNDTPGTDNGQGDGFNAYAPEVKEGNKVVKGQLIGYMGDSGNAETTQAHLHFEIRLDGQAFSPYRSLQNAARITTPVPAPQQDNEILPYENFSGGMSVAAANLDKDSDIEYVTGAGPGGGPLVKAFDHDGDQIAAFYAYGQNFRGGIDVTAADIDDDGRAEIITAPGPGGGPHIKIFKTDGKLVREFFAYDASFTGGVFVSAADMDNDGVSEIVTGAGPGGGPHVKVFASDGTLQHQVFPYDHSFRGGVDVAAIASARSSSRRSSSSRTAGGFATAPGRGGGPHVKVFDTDAKLDEEFFAYEGNFNVGLRIAAGNASTGSSGLEIGVIPATTGGPHAKLFSRSGHQVFSGFVGFEPWWRGGYDIALHEGGGVVGSNGGRRDSLREVVFRSSTRDRSRSGHSF